MKNPETTRKNIRRTVISHVLLTLFILAMFIYSVTQQAAGV